MSGTRSTIFSCTVFSFALLFRISSWKINTSSSNYGGFQLQSRFMKLYFSSCYRFLGYCPEKLHHLLLFLFQNYVLGNWSFVGSGYFCPLLSNHSCSALTRGIWVIFSAPLAREVEWTLYFCLQSWPELFRGRIANMEMKV